MKNENKNNINLVRIKMIIYQCLTVFLVCFFAIGLLYINSAKETFAILASLESHGYVMIYVWVYVALLVVLFMVRKKIYYCDRRNLLFLLFMIAFIPRILLITQRNYIPTSDFRKYYDMGVHLVEGDKTFVRELISDYHIPKFGGLAVFMGIVAKLFSENLIGFQLANIFIASFICVYIYLCIENYSKMSAIIAAILFAVYPGNIISSQVTTNHHSAILFTLIGFYLLISVDNAGRYKKIIFSAASGIFLAFSDFCHPSVIVPIIAVICYGAMGCLGKKKIDFSRIRYCTCAVLCYIFTINIGLLCLKNLDIVSEQTLAQTPPLPLSKIVVGFNEESRGTWSAEDQRIARSLSNEEKQQWIMQQIEERVFQKSLGDIFLLFRDKVNTVWFKQDSYFYWYYTGWKTDIKEKLDNEKISEDDYWQEVNQIEIYSSYALFDWIFLKVIYIFAIIGLIVQRKKENEAIELFIWILLGWILIHLLIEVQPRYRYLGIPYIFALAGIGAEWIYRISRGIREHSFVSDR